jgi:glutamine amidotransferase
MKIISVLDYGSSNLRSVVKALEHVADRSYDIVVSNQADQILLGDKVVFPGQGAIGQCMENLIQKELVDVVKDCISTKPFLGICLGLQSLVSESEEDGGTKGLGIIPGTVKHFPTGRQDEDGNTFKIPHMGWNKVMHVQDHPLWSGINQDERFYFVHSYYVDPDNEEDCVGSTDYIFNYCSAIARDNLFAVQFHPEKSQQAGLRLLKNFLNW